MPVLKCETKNSPFSCKAGDEPVLGSTTGLHHLVWWMAFRRQLANYKQKVLDRFVDHLSVSVGLINVIVDDSE